MANQELLNYVKAQLKNKISKETLSANLVAQGWQQSDVDSAISEANSPVGTAAASTIPSSVVSGGDEKKNGMTVAALVVSILGFISTMIWFVGGPLGIIGLVLGIMGLKSKKHGMAIASIILSSLAITTAIGYGILSASPALRSFEHQLLNIPDESTSTAGKDAVVQDLVISDLLDPIPYVNSTYNFEINMPKDWIQVDGTAYKTTTFFTNPMDRAKDLMANNANILTNVYLSEGISLDEAIIKYNTVEAQGLSNYSKINDSEVILSDNSSARMITRSFLEAGDIVYVETLVTIKDGYIYDVTGKTLKSRWPIFGDMITASLKTFKKN